MEASGSKATIIATAIAAVAALLTSPIWGPAICRGVHACAPEPKPSPVATYTPIPATTTPVPATTTPPVTQSPVPTTTRPAGLSAPVQLSPADNSLFTNFPRTTTLTWRPVAGAVRYRVEIQCDTCGSTPWTSWKTDTTTATNYSFTWVGDNVGRWQVTAIATDGTAGTASGWWRFSYHTPPAVLPAPAQLSPADNSLFTNFPRTTTLTWQAVAGAARYQVEIQCDTCGSTPWTSWKTDTTTATTYTFTWVGDNVGRWRVTAITANGTAGTASGWRQFRYQT